MIAIAIAGAMTAGTYCFKSLAPLGSAIEKSHLASGAIYIIMGNFTVVQSPPFS